MKRFTKFSLITALVLAVFGVACLLGAFSLGMSFQTLEQMVENGKFSFGPEDVTVDFSEKTYKISEACESLDIEFGAGSLTICYEDVNEVEVRAKGITNFDYSVKHKTLYVEGSLAGNQSKNGALSIVIPKGMYFEEVKLELGASKAEILNLEAETVHIEVGAGEAVVRELEAQSVHAETGVGRMEILLAGKEEDYNYQVECGIGAITIGRNSYGGLGTSQNIKNLGAKKNVDLECGIGKIELDFVE